MTVQVTIPVSNVSSLIALGYTKIEVWRSTDSGNSYKEVTSSAASSASLSSISFSTTVDMNGGKLLKFKVDGGTELTVSFSGSPVRYWTPQQVRDQINTVSNVATVVGSKVVLTSPTTGQASTIEITYNDTDLGFTAGQKVFGILARPSLTLGVYVYTFTDLNGTSSYSYRWRFSANGANPISEYSTPVHGSALAIVSPLSVATATFVGVNGIGKKVTLVVTTEVSPQIFSGVYVINDVPGIFQSDDTGFIQIPMLRNIRVRVGIEGTPFVRDFTVPDVATFDLISAMASASDPFTIQIPLPLITRTGP
jgi:hypothetical protein